MKADLGRKVLDHVTVHREQFDMDIFGVELPVCGTTACLAGWAMLLSGYKLVGYEAFRRPDGTRVHGNTEEAMHLLDLTEAELEDDRGRRFLFYILSEDEAIARFRALVEAAEAEAAK
jgi:hypothetical protein